MDISRNRGHYYGHVYSYIAMAIFQEMRVLRSFEVNQLQLGGQNVKCALFIQPPSIYLWTELLQQGTNQLIDAQPAPHSSTITIASSIPHNIADSYS